MSLIYWPIISGSVAASSPAQTDPFFSSVVQLAHFNGTNGSTTFTNSCPRGNTMTSGGSAVIDTSVSKFDGASLHTVAANSFAVGATNSDYNFSTNPWTVEFWANINTLANTVLFDMRDTSNTAAWVPTITMPDSLGSIRYLANGAARITSSTGALSTGTWYFIVACRAAGVTRLFVNGNQVGSDFTDGNTYVQNQIVLAASGGHLSGTPGHYDDLRITNGVGRYSSNFSVPTSAFPNS
jgi:hypothetical protein